MPGKSQARQTSGSEHVRRKAACESPLSGGQQGKPAKDIRLAGRKEITNCLTPMQLIPESSSYRNPDQQEDLYRLERKVDQLLNSLEPVPSQDFVAEPPPPGLLTYWNTLKRRKFVVMLAGAALGVCGLVL